MNAASYFRRSFLVAVGRKDGKQWCCPQVYCQNTEYSHDNEYFPSTDRRNTPVTMEYPQNFTSNLLLLPSNSSSVNHHSLIAQ
jgi:hypothetical protein